MLHLTFPFMKETRIMLNIVKNIYKSSGESGSKSSDKTQIDHEEGVVSLSQANTHICTRLAGLPKGRGKYTIRYTLSLPKTTPVIFFKVQGVHPTLNWI